MEGSIKTIKPRPRPKSNASDIVSKVIGDFGRWQLRICLMMALLKFPLAWYQLSIVFLAPPQEFWCVKPELFSKYTVKEWRAMCSPVIEEHPCLIFDPAILFLAPDLDRSMIPLVECKKFEYDTSVFVRTITSDWDLVCKYHWLFHLTQCTVMFGIFLGGTIFGIVSDKYGRKNPLIIAIIMQGLFSYLVGFMPSYWTFLTCTMIMALASGGVAITSFVLLVEAVGGKWRTIMPILIQVPFGLGNPILAGLAYWLRDWRKLQFALSSLSSLLIILCLWIPESPRWLLANGNRFKAYELLKDIAKLNKIKFDEDEVSQLLSTPVEQKEKPNFFAYYKSKYIRIITVTLSISWFLAGLAFYAFSQCLGSMSNGPFLALTLAGLISTPGPIICVFVIMKMGRKHTIEIFQLTTVLCFICILLIPKGSFSNDWPRILFAGIGFGGMVGAVPVLYLFSGELFPTIGRNAGLSCVSMFARIGSMVAPVVVSLDEWITDLPLMILAVTSLIQILLIIPLPETMNQPLPDTLEQAEQLRYIIMVFKFYKQQEEGRKKKNWTRILNSIIKYKSVLIYVTVPLINA